MKFSDFDCIICVGHASWDGPIQNSAVQLLSELSERHLVIYIDYQYTYKDLLTAKKNPGASKKPIPPANNLEARKLDSNRTVFIWTPPPILPLNWMDEFWHDKLQGLNAAKIAKGIKAAMKQLKVKRPLLLNAFNPVWGVLLTGKLNEAASIYYCYDEITAEDWIKRHGARYEQMFLKTANAVITTSDVLFKSKSVYNPKTFCIKNGANYQLFSQALQLGRSKPSAPAKVGYLGTADNRMNASLMAYCLENMPDIMFEFIGEVNDPSLYERLGSYPNMQFTASVKVEQLPALMANFSAAIIPFNCSSHTATIYPLKINEYLAAGLPVVTTPFAPMEDLTEVIAFAERPEDFVAALRQALADHDPQNKERRLAVARANSWQNRAIEFENVIKEIGN